MRADHQDLEWIGFEREPQWTTARIFDHHLAALEPRLHVEPCCDIAATKR